MKESLEVAGFTPELLEVKKKIAFPNLHGDTKAWKTIRGAGHAVGHIRSGQTADEIANDLADDFARAGRDDPSLAVRPRW